MDCIFEEIQNLRRSGMSLAEIEARLKEVRGRRLALLVGDSSGFTRRSRSHGVVHFLDLIGRMREMVRPVLCKNGAVTMRFEADNVYAAFETVDEAVDTALGIHATLMEHNLKTTEENHFFLCIGIAYGDVLQAGPEGYYGNEMNVAAKLGEDIARSGQTLLSDAAKMALTRDDLELAPQMNEIGGASFKYHRIKTGL